MKRGKYIVFEGVVGSGKTTQSKLLVERLKKDFPKKEIIWTREPGGSEIAGAIRRLVQASEYEEEMEPVSEAYLYAAARAQMLRKVVWPALKRGAVVVSDRSFVTSLAFQAGGRGLPFDLVLEINKSAIGHRKPDILFFIDMDPAMSLKRARDKIGDKWERMPVEFFRKTRKGYLFAKKKLRRVWVDVDGSKSVEEISDEIYSRVLRLLRH